jgi:hypothetical protein
VSKVAKSAGSVECSNVAANNGAVPIYFYNHLNKNTKNSKKKNSKKKFKKKFKICGANSHFFVTNAMREL